VSDDLQPVPSGVAQHAASLRVADNMSSRVHCVAVSATLGEAARLLAEHPISCLVVLDGEAPAGIITERDIVREAARKPEGWGATSVRDVMSHPLHVADTGATVARSSPRAPATGCGAYPSWPTAAVWPVSSRRLTSCAPPTATSRAMRPSSSG